MGGEGTEEIILSDPIGGVYKRLVLKDDKLVGACLYGDTVDGSWYFKLLRDGRSITEVVGWAGRPGDAEPIRILRHASQAAEGWADDLASQAAADPRTRDGVWAGVRRAFDCFADPRVLAACSPHDSEAFDPVAFLAERGTLYIVG